MQGFSMYLLGDYELIYSDFIYLLRELLICLLINESSFNPI